MEQHRPDVILKWAESADGFMAPDYRPYWISSPWQNLLNHRWRTEEAAILVGSQTYLDDHPRLTARHWCGNNPQPVLLDRRGRIPSLPPNWIHLQSPTPADALADLYARGIQSLIVEGGRHVLDAFLSAGLYDEVRILRNTACLLHGGTPAPQAPPSAMVYS